MLRLAAIAAFASSFACETDRNTQVLVFVETEEGALEGAASMRVRACRDTDAPDCTGGYAREQPMASVTFPARVPVGPPSDAGERFWLEATLLGPTGEPLNTVRAIAGFRQGQVRSVRLRFEPSCAAIACPMRATCYEGGCVDACLETGNADSNARSVPIACDSEPFDAGLPDAGTDADTCTCPCSDDVCLGGVCTPSKPVDVVATGRFHTCTAAIGAREIYCWGENTAGQLGLGAERVGDIVSAPAAIALAAPVHSIAAGVEHTCAVLDDGRAFCWGSNGNRRLGTTSAEDAPAPAAIPRPGGDNWDRIALESDHSCGLSTTGVLYCWGRANSGQTGLFDRPLPDRQNTPLPLEGSFADVSVGTNFTCALLRGGGTRCWGVNGNGQIAQPEAVMLAPRPVGVTVAGSQDIEAGASHACVISRDRRELRCWGYSGSGRLGIGPIEMAMPVREPSLVMGGLSWSSASLGWSHSCAIADGGHLYCFGYNIAGQLGMGGFDRASRVAPTEVAPIGSWTAVSSGETHTCAIRDGGQLWCWGEGSAGQLSDSCGRTDTSTPCRVCL